MSVTTDSVYIDGWNTYNRIAALTPRPGALLDSYTITGSAFASLYNTLAIARGDALIGGTAPTAEARNSILDANGNFQPNIRGAVQGMIATLNGAYPPPSATVIPTPGGGGGVVVVPPGNGGLLDGLSGILDGEIFGIPKKYLILGAAAYFLFKD